MKTICEEGEPPVSVSTPRALRRGPRIQIKRILVPLDFSRAAMQALRYAMALSGKFKAEIHLLHVTSPDEVSTVADARQVMRECAEAVAFMQEKLGIVARRHVPAFWPRNCHVRPGKPFQEICEQAREIRADLIVLATRGNRGLKRIVLGSTAERVVRFSPCPVLIVRQRRRSGKNLPNVVTAKHAFRLRRILVPVDFSACGVAGAMYAALLAKTFDAKLRLIHVVRPPAPIVIDRVSANLTGRNDLDVAQAKHDMKAFVKQNFLAGAKCETEIQTGNPVDVICGASRRPDIDVLVTSTHGRTGFNHLLLGSVAEQVLRYAECPVLIAPSRCSVKLPEPANE